MSYQDVRHWYEERDEHDDYKLGRHDHEPPHSVFVTWFDEVSVRDYYSGAATFETVQCGRWFPAERWAWKHAQAWQRAMEKRHGHATIEEEF